MEFIVRTIITTNDTLCHKFELCRTCLLQVAACVNQNNIWEQGVQIHRLVTNVRAANAGDAHEQQLLGGYSGMLLRLGSRDMNHGDEVIAPLPYTNSVPSIDALIDAVYPDFGAECADDATVDNYLRSRCILAPTNVMCDAINDKLSEKLTSPECRTYTAANWTCDPRDAVTHPSEHLADIEMSGLPPQTLSLR